MFFLLSTEGSLVITRAYTALYLGGTPSHRTSTNPLAVYSSRTVYLCQTNIFLFVSFQSVEAEFFFRLLPMFAQVFRFWGFHVKMFERGWGKKSIFLSYFLAVVKMSPKNKQKQTGLQYWNWQYHITSTEANCIKLFTLYLWGKKSIIPFLCLRNNYFIYFSESDLKIFQWTF